uniref:Uncharacterized protein n=1 Tax=Opuntia streptacantha TaxID=393608 RepID=A0A7C9EDF6_OPUST
MWHGRALWHGQTVPHPLLSLYYLKPFWLSDSLSPSLLSQSLTLSLTVLPLSLNISLSSAACAQTQRPKPSISSPKAKTAQTAATKFSSLIKILATTPEISAVNFLASTTRSLHLFPQEASRTSTVIQVTSIASTATAAIDMTPNTTPSAPPPTEERESTCTSRIRSIVFGCC